MNKWVMLMGLVAAWPAASALAGQQYGVVFLEPPGYQPTYAQGIAGGQQVGYSSGGPSHALLWTGSAGSAVDLNPSGFVSSKAWATDGIRQVGQGVTQSLQGSHAVLWSGSAASAVDLHPLSGYTDSGANGIGGGQQVGSALTTGGAPHAVLWSGTAASAVDLNPLGYQTSWARATDGTRQVGFGDLTPGPGVSTEDRALLWEGAAASAIDLTPPGYIGSQAWGISGNHVVGWAGGHAALWNLGDGRSFVDLNPSWAFRSELFATSGAYQVGDATSGGVYRATVWTGTADSAIDLGQFLPVTYGVSIAYGVDPLGNVVGAGNDGNGWHALMWVPVPEPSAAIALSSAAGVGALARRRRAA